VRLAGLIGDQEEEEKGHLRSLFGQREKRRTTGYFPSVKAQKGKDQGAQEG